jgi:hypothetical protein
VATADRRKPRLFDEAAKWKKDIEGFSQGQLEQAHAQLALLPTNDKLQVLATLVTPRAATVSGSACLAPTAHIVARDAHAFHPGSSTLSGRPKSGAHLGEIRL